jgi:hypothetical protein
MSFCDRKCESCISSNNGWFTNFILNTYDKLLPTSIWVRRFNELPKLTMYMATTIYQLAFWGIFFYLVVTSYYHGVRDSWLSRDQSSGDCDEVIAMVSGTFSADYNGNWDSSEFYDRSRAVYGIDLRSYSRGSTEFASDVSYIDNVIGAVGDKVCL